MSNATAEAGLPMSSAASVDARGVSWEPAVPGVYSRTLRFGEWISEPVTPLFESWLLTTMEERFHAGLRQVIGQRIPRPYHVVVNGWYFYTLNWLAPGAWARSLPTILWRIARTPRVVAGIFPPTVRYAFPLLEGQWRDEIQPGYRAAAARAEGEVDNLPVSELPALVDDLADRAGAYFLAVAGLAGAAYKMELNLARFYRRHLVDAIGGSHQTLLAGLDAPTAPDRHAVVSLDWWHATLPHAGTGTMAPERHRQLVEARQAAEAAAFEALAASPRQLRAFRRLLLDAQHLVPLREEQVREWTVTWPVMRRALLRIGEALVASGAIGVPEDVFFLTRDEALAALGGGRLPADVDVAGRRTRREAQTKVGAPLLVGRLSPMLQRLWDAYPRMFGAVKSDSAIVSGWPTSPGRATGSVRLVMGPDEFDALQPGEILVAPITAPAWTPLFTLAAAVVTDVGTAASHASIIAREYGIPAVVGCGDATARLRTGMRVSVDGGTGNVEPA
jgi:phosphohistidine swiveling domain-containing protein